jgi:hypothetical protein
VLVVLDLATLVELWTFVEVVVACWDVLVWTSGDEDEEVLTLVVLVEPALLVLEVLIAEEELDVFWTDEVLLVVAWVLLVKRLLAVE